MILDKVKSLLRPDVDPSVKLRGIKVDCANSVVAVATTATATEVFQWVISPNLYHE